MKNLFLSLILIGSFNVNAETFYECQAECRYFGVVYAAAPTATKAFDIMKSDCEVLMYNASPCETHRALLYSVRIPGHYSYPASPLNPLVCRKSEGMIPELSHPVKIQRPYCGSGTPQG